ncbi:MAG: UvrB/UvrC motif-containing protein [Kiritimatiellae bacterium]|nr:UvrB/UvrC motif-containing protein [Kiritimatiellia bacterium]
MKCELCHQADAEVAIKQAADGQVRELFVCQACARQAHGQSPENLLVELLFGAAFNSGAAEPTESRCPVCGFSRKEYRKRSRLGCAACYEHFARELAPVLRDMHRGSQHAGKVPHREHAAVETERIENDLRQAVETQRFEEAARLRDRLRALRAAAPAKETGGDARAQS